MAHGDLVNSLLKGLDILNIVSNSESGLRLNDISDLLGEKQSTTYNLVRTLSARGFLDKATGNRHVIGPAIAELQMNQQRRKIMESSAIIIRGLSEEILDSYPTLTELSGTDIAVRLRMSPDRPGLLQKPNDMRFSLYSTSSGLCHLAFANEERKSQIMDHFPFDEFASSQWNDLEELDDYLSKIRKDGYCSLKIKDLEAFRVAVPIFAKDNQMAACLGLRKRLSEKGKTSERRKLIQKVIKAAAEISKHI